MLPTSIPDSAGNEKSGLDMYFLEQDGGTFKATVCTVDSRRFQIIVSAVREMHAHSVSRRYTQCRIPTAGQPPPPTHSIENEHVVVPRVTKNQ